MYISFSSLLSLMLPFQFPIRHDVACHQLLKQALRVCGDEGCCVLLSADLFQSSSGHFLFHSRAAGRRVLHLSLLVHNSALHRAEKPNPDLASLFTDPSVAPDPGSGHGLKC